MLVPVRANVTALRGTTFGLNCDQDSLCLAQTALVFAVTQTLPHQSL